MTRDDTTTERQRALRTSHNHNAQAKTRRETPAERERADEHEETRDESRGGTAAWTPREFLLGHVVGQFVMLGLIAVGLICGGTVAWIACGRSRTEDYNRSLREALWFSWGVFFDPGTQTGLRADERLGPKCVAVVFSILGFVFNLVLLGLIVERVKDLLELWVRRFGKVVLCRHV